MTGVQTCALPIFSASGREFEVASDGINLICDYIENLNRGINNLGARRVNGVFAAISDEILYDIEIAGPKIILDAALIKKVMPLEKLITKSRRDPSDHIG